MNHLIAIPESFNFSSKKKECHLADKNNKCPHCHKIMANSWYIKQHIKSVHEKLKPFQCDQCFAKFGFQFSLIRHTAKIHQNNTAQHTQSINCHMCHYKFTIQSDLKRHVKHVHENVKPFSCDQCDHKYRSNADLKRHVRCVHQNLRPFICSWCTAKFGDNFSLKRHSNKLHANEEQNNLQNLNEGVNFILDLSMTKRIAIKSEPLNVIT